MNTPIKNYSYTINGKGCLEIYITDANDNEFIVAEIYNCKGMTIEKQNNLALEILTEKEYILI